MAERNQSQGESNANDDSCFLRLLLLLLLLYYIIILLRISHFIFYYNIHTKSQAIDKLEEMLDGGMKKKSHMFGPAEYVTIYT